MLWDLDAYRQVSLHALWPFFTEDIAKLIAFEFHDVLSSIPGSTHLVYETFVTIAPERDPIASCEVMNVYSIARCPNTDIFIVHKRSHTNEVPLFNSDNERNFFKEATLVSKKILIGSNVVEMKCVDIHSADCEDLKFEEIEDSLKLSVSLPNE